MSNIATSIEMVDRLVNRVQRTAAALKESRADTLLEEIAINQMIIMGALCLLLANGGGEE
jgi:hypothetical protein